MTVRSEVFRLLEEGVGKTEIGRRLGLSRHQVYRMTSGSRVSPSKPVPWGTGAATLVPVSTSRETELVVFGSDFHFPYHDRKAIESFLWLIVKLQPDRVVLNGDIADFFQLSRFNVSGDRVQELQAEIDLANEFRRLVRLKAQNAVIDEVCGNHDDRVMSYVRKNAQALQSLTALKPASLFRYAELEINYHEGCGFLLRPEYLVKHGTIVRSEGGATAKAELTNAGISGISGHTHRMARYTKGGYSQRVWVEQGCLCRTDPDYVPGGLPNWQQGCAVGEFSTKAPYHFLIHDVPFVRGKLRLGRESF